MSCDKPLLKAILSLFFSLDLCLAHANKEEQATSQSECYRLWAYQYMESLPADNIMEN